MRKISKDDIVYFFHGISKQQPICPYCGSRPVVYAKKYLVIDVCKCQKCCLFFVNPMYLSDSDLKRKEFYNNSYTSVAAIIPEIKDLELMKKNNFSGSSKDFNNRLTIIRKLAEGNRLLEFASSWGYFLFQSLAYGFHPTGIEISSSRASFGRKFLGANIFPDLASIQKKFDVICSFHTLEHLVDLTGIFDKLYDILLPGGSLILEVPNFDPETKGKPIYSIIGKVHPLGFTEYFFESNLSRHGFSELNIAGSYEDLLKEPEKRLPLNDVIIVHAKKSKNR